MKKITIVALVLSVALAACQKSERAQTEQAALATAASKVEIKVPTVQCNTCVGHVTDALQTLDGVKSAEIDLHKKIAFVSFDPSQTNLSAMENAVAQAGYDANETKRDAEAYDALDACCKVPENHGDSK